MNRRCLAFQNMELDLWPVVDRAALSPEKRAFFELRLKAIDAYAMGATLREIEQETGINGRQLHRTLKRCLQQAEDGRIYGYRGLIKHSRVGAYLRTEGISDLHVSSKSGLAGAFAMLLESYPILCKWIAQKIKQHSISVIQVNTEGKLKIRLKGIKNLHASFIIQCRGAGISATEYPLNTDRMGIGAFASFVKREMLANFGTTAHAAGAKNLKGFPQPVVATQKGATYPYQIVEFDGHRLDVRLKIVIQDPLGLEQEFEIERIWLLVIIDVCTRAVLGYHLVLSREYSRYDVIKTIEKAITPHTSKIFQLPNVGYGASGGFPSGKLPELGYAIWERMRLDNAKANLSNETITALCEFIGCAVDAGPPHHPDDRPYIERFFGTIANSLSARMPGYTGSCTADVRRALADVKGNLRLFVSLTEMEELMEASIAAYNATPHDGLNGKSPLEAMTYFVRAKSHMVFWLPEAKRKTMCLMQTAQRCRVRGYLLQGTRGHITLFQVRYTNQVLAASGTLLGRDLRIYYNSDDLRTVRAFLNDGTEIGILKAQGAWGEIVHDLKLRREIMKMRGKKKLGFTVSQEFIDHFVEAKKSNAKKSRRAASDLERTLRTLAGAPTTKTASVIKENSQSGDDTSQENDTTSDHASPSNKKKVEPQKLTIGWGFNSAL